MAPHLPIEDPSERGSLADRTVAYVRAHPLLRILLVVTVIDYVLAILLVVTGRMDGQIAGIVALFSVLSWFFAVCIPVMNRELRLRLSGSPSSYWTEVADMFWRVLLCAVTGLYTVLLIRAAL